MLYRHGHSVLHRAGPLTKLTLIVLAATMLPLWPAPVLLATAALVSFFAGSVTTVLIALFSPPLAEVAMKFGPAEYFSLMVLGLLVSVSLSSGSIIKAMAMTLLGILIGIVGTDVTSGVERFTLGLSDLFDGINFVPVAIGMFGLAEIVRNIAGGEGGARSIQTKNISGLMLSLADLKRIITPSLRGTGLGSILGILPGGGVVLASFASYALEKNVSKEPSRFGKGAIEGVAAPEAANNASAAGVLVPMLTLGLPTSATAAMRSARTSKHISTKKLWTSPARAAMSF